uniref:Uncharacterized protein n=1 Tax=Arundo donax TaxID=35708 RepID=A0A0A9E0L1_ARUDO
MRGSLFHGFLLAENSHSSAHDCRGTRKQTADSCPGPTNIPAAQKIQDLTPRSQTSNWLFLSVVIILPVVQ